MYATFSRLEGAGHGTGMRVLNVDEVWEVRNNGGSVFDGSNGMGCCRSVWRRRIVRLELRVFFSGVGCGECLV